MLSSTARSVNETHAVLSEKAATFSDSSDSLNVRRTSAYLNAKTAVIFIAEQHHVCLSLDSLPLLAFFNNRTALHVGEHRLTTLGLQGLSFINAKAARICGTWISSSKIRENLAWLNAQIALVLSAEENARTYKQLGIIAFINVETAIDYADQEEGKSCRPASAAKSRCSR
ncbi:hypothetical protein HDU89_008968 [Geranomyces variabilis]|nr:hypothetical protein HDU89_008968 [Geranomyces variabilis]